MEDEEQVAQQMQKEIAGNSGRAGMTSLSGRSGEVLLGKTYRDDTMDGQIRVPIAIQSIKQRRNIPTYNHFYNSSPNQISAIPD